MVSQEIPLEIYQFRLYLKHISPLIWRRFVVKSDTSIADFHHLIQLSLGWSSTHLHQFIIQGKYYGISYIGGRGFRDNPEKVLLKGFQFRPKEKFKYEYNFNDGWEYEIRFEGIVPFNSKKPYPLCIGGNYMAPPEECGGVEGFQELEDHYSLYQIEEDILQLIEDYKAGEDDIEDSLENLSYWANRHKFDRRKVNELFREFEINGEEAYYEI